MSRRISRLTTFILAALAVVVAVPAFAVWPMPQYSSYPDCNGTTPAENCSHRQSR